MRIFEAVKLPNMDGFSEKMRQITSNLPSPFQKAKAKAKEHAPNMVITSDPYATVVLAGARVARTRVISNDANPKWNEHFSIPVAHYVYDVVFTVKDQDVLGTQHIGDVKIPVELVLSGGVVEGWYDLLTKEGKVCYVGARLRLSVRYMPVEQNLIYTQGVGPDAHGVPYTYFPLRKGCKLTLYQDTHIYDNSLPEIFLENSMIYQQRRCWEDLCTAINDARYLVYIAGWSVYDKTKLIRDVHRPVREGGNLTLGELLKKKASQGVRVLLLVWADKTSHDYSYFKTVRPNNWVLCYLSSIPFAGSCNRVFTTFVLYLLSVFDTCFEFPASLSSMLFPSCLRFSSLSSSIVQFWPTPGSTLAS